MNVFTQARWKSPAVATVLVLVGLLWSIHSARTGFEALRRIRRNQAEWKEIKGLEMRLKRTDPFRDEILRKVRDPLADPILLYSKMWPELTPPSVREEAPEERIDGLRVRRIEFEFREAPLSAFGGWITSCENLSPPWRASKIRIDARASAPGSARIALTLEGIESAQP
ncbi:MAG: hypothetical protein U1E27_06410 [Kiritimatiellia bacterium]|nr:hypothetical protein [Kiritimatiellia bacterium]